MQLRTEKGNGDGIGLKIRNAYRRILKIRGTPREIALGMALGLFVGMTPVMGFQTAVAVFFAMLFNWNKISAAIAVWITNPFTALPIYSVTYLIGAWVTGVNKPLRLSRELDFAMIVNMFSKAPEIFWALWVGGIIVGIPLAIVGYYFTFTAVSKYQDEIKQRIARQKEKLVRGKEKLKNIHLSRKTRQKRKKKKKKRRLK